MYRVLAVAVPDQAIGRRSLFGTTLARRNDVPSFGQADPHIVVGIVGIELCRSVELMGIPLVLDRTATTSWVMTSTTLVVAGSRPSPTTRQRTSRSVKIPTISPEMQTSSAPIRSSFIFSTASRTVVSGIT